MISPGSIAWHGFLVAGLDSHHLQLLQTVLRRCSLVQALREHNAEEQGAVCTKPVLTLATCSSPANGDPKLMVLHKSVGLSSSSQIEQACTRIVGTANVQDDVAVLHQMDHTRTSCPVPCVGRHMSTWQPGVSMITPHTSTTLQSAP